MDSFALFTHSYAATVYKYNNKPKGYVLDESSISIDSEVEVMYNLTQDPFNY